jgi:hypothetical protein
MAITKRNRKNFDTLLKAIRTDRVSLLECQDKATNKVVNVIVILNHDGDDINMVPFAKMFDGNPYEEINPPLPEGGFSNE